MPFFTFSHNSTKHRTWLRFLFLLWIPSLVYLVTAPGGMFTGDWRSVLSQYDDGMNIWAMVGECLEWGWIKMVLCGAHTVCLCVCVWGGE